jgi:hypothetical protein
MNAGEGKSVCFHLNGHNITSPNARALYGSSSILNVMGEGTVSGRAPDTYGPGSAVQSNTSNKNGTINLYAGTYKQVAGAAPSEYTVNLNDAGKINVYRDATICGNVSGNAYRVGTPRSNSAFGSILGANIEGNVPNGSYVRWESSNGNFDKDADGSKLEIIAKNKGYTTFTAILCDADGNELARDSVEMYSKSGFFDKIGGFFRSLFGATKVYDK